MNLPSKYPCPNCNDHRVTWNINIPYFILTCKKCTWSWKQLMTDAEEEHYTNIKLKEFLSFREQPEHPLERSIRDQKVIQIKKKRSLDIRMAKITGDPYIDYSIPDSSWL